MDPLKKRYQIILRHQTILDVEINPIVSMFY